MIALIQGANYFQFHQQQPFDERGDCIKRARIQPADGAVQIRHRLPVPVNITSPFTAVLLAVTTEVEELDLIDIEAKAEYQNLIDI